ncbi:hypothetical protein THF1C08_110107 [Vibrio jasicida]|uniref:Uncharacterized protein n=1 Tax=Vibrio jasicida TaxID=766224 RepID=A0AAU9QFT1_9VIBR|nr:hypothetical protein THF1C08_110107 [Vibrio jasicida]CAH1569234.1 hypothetical protein THF1A12_100108 [Vibrio jasicida]
MIAITQELSIKFQSIKDFYGRTGTDNDNGRLFAGIYLQCGTHLSFVKAARPS